ncbi:ATP-binding protein [Patescibacteria group bacterium]|nr:ATP-binding protein [Patescibacteria group bacterium]
MYKKRHLEQTILKLSKSFPVILLTGPRQVGKTTLYEFLRKKIGHNYVSLDEFEIRSLAKNDPGLFLEQYPSPLIIDEIQYVPQLLPYIKSKVDATKNKCSYWLTGSQYFHLMRGVSESLAGRVAILKLLGISQAEEINNPQSKKPWTPELVNINQKYAPINLLKLFKKIVRGNFPKFLHRNCPPLENFYGSYVQTYIDRDLRNFVRAGSLSDFEKFIRLCAGRTAQLLNLSDLARDSGVTTKTAKEWLSLLEMSGHIYLLKPYYKNISKRLTKIPKLYFLDTGLACYLTGWKTPEATLKGAMAGPLFETFILTEIIKSYWNRGQEAPLWYYRTKEKEEVDFLIEKNGKLYPIETKLSYRITDGDLRGIRSIKKSKALLGKTIFISATTKAYSLAKNIIVVPYTIIENF